MTRRRLVLTGTVQGVGFRWFVVELARSLGLSGWVRNREDGAVEAEVEGPEARVDEFVARARKEHPPARVQDVAAVAVAPQGAIGFEIRR